MQSVKQKRMKQRYFHGQICGPERLPLFLIPSNTPLVKSRTINRFHLGEYTERSWRQAPPISDLLAAMTTPEGSQSMITWPVLRHEPERTCASETWLDHCAPVPRLLSQRPSLWITAQDNTTRLRFFYLKAREDGAQDNII